MMDFAYGMVGFPVHPLGSNRTWANLSTRNLNGTPYCRLKLTAVAKASIRPEMVDPSFAMVMTLMFAGHDTTHAAISFMFYELARNPDVAGRVIAEQDALLEDGRPTAAQLTSGELTELEIVLDETLRKHPPAWVGPRRSLVAFEFAGHAVPERAFVNYSSWASHHLADVFTEPAAFRPNPIG